LSRARAYAAEPGARWTALSLTVVILCFILNGIDGANVFAVSYLAPIVARDWRLSPAMLGVVFSSLLAGMGVGGLFLAPLADRFGRRTMVLVSLLLMAGGMILTSLSTWVGGFAFARAIVGLGIGTVLACMTALVYEFSPAGSRRAAVGLLQAGYPIAAAASGFATAWAVQHYSWRAVMLFSGLCTLAFFPVLFVLLPESVGFLLHAQPEGALKRINKIRLRLGAEPLAELPERIEEGRRRSHLSELLGSGLRRNTLLLWAAIFCGFVVLYAVISWIPRLAIEAGLNTSAGIVAGAIYNGGAFAGTFALSILTKIANLQRLILFFLLSAAVCLVAFGLVPAYAPVVLLVAFLIGVTLQGGFNGMYPLASEVYPLRVRSSGIGTAIGIGRAGAIAGPLMTGYMLEAHAKLPVVFVVLAIPAVVAACCSFAIRIAKAEAV